MVKDLINKLERVLKFSKQSFKISKVLNSDTEVEYAELKEGAEVLVSSSTGSTVATDGEYQLENGDKFIVKDGVIAEVISVQPEEEMEKEDEEEKIEEVIKAPEEEKVEIEITEEVEESESEKEIVEEDKEKQEEVNEVEALKVEIELLKEMIEQLKAELPKSIESFKKEFMKELKTTPAQTFNKVVVDEESENDKWSRMAKQFS